MIRREGPGQEEERQECPPFHRFTAQGSLSSSKGGLTCRSPKLGLAAKENAPQFHPPSISPLPKLDLLIDPPYEFNWNLVKI